MKKAKYLLAVLAGVIVYVLLCSTCGRNGIWAANQLLEQKRSISANTQAIENINEELKLEKTAIQNDREVIAAYARKLGYVSEGEKLVKIKGLGSLSDMSYDTGTVMKAKEVTYCPELICKFCGVFIAVVLLVLLFIYDISNGNISFRKKQRYEVVEGIPVYDVNRI